MTDESPSATIDVGTLPIPAALIDGGGRVVAASALFEELVGRGSRGLAGKAVLDLVAPEDRGRLASAWTGSAAAEVDVAGVGEDGLPYVATFAVPGGDPAATRLLVARRRLPPAQWRDLAGAGEPDGRDEIDGALSHDVRGALRGVAGFLAVLDGEGSALSDEGRGFLDTARRSAATADAMAERLVEYARLGQRPLVVDRVDLDVLAGLVIDDRRDDDGDDVTPLPVSVGQLASVVGNRSLLESLVSELLTNAAKFGATSVDVSCRTDGSWLYLCVADDGPGIDEELRLRAFDLFRMLQPKGRYPGIGAGLAVVRRIAEVHGGSVWIESGDDGGSALVTRLPLAQA